MLRKFLGVPRKIEEVLYDRSIAIDDRLTIVLISISVIGSFLGLLICLLAGVSVWGDIIVGAIFLTTPIMLTMAVRIKQKEIGFTIIIIGLAILIPLLWMMAGGISSGMNCWFIYELFFIAIASHKKSVVRNLLIAMVLQMGCYIFSYFNYDKVSQLQSRTDAYISSVGSVLVVSICLILTVISQKYVYSHEKELGDKKEQSLQKANEAQKLFLANMSHEIRSPLNGILGMNEMMFRATSLEEVREYATSIEQAGQTLLSLVNDILDFSKIESGNMEIIAGEYNTMDLINECHTLVAKQAEDKKLAFQVFVAPSVPKRFFGDNIKIRQIITNLLTNAIKYTEEGVVDLLINAKPLDDDNMLFQIAVRDTGIGISEEGKKELFTKFQRLNQQKTKYIEGTGLGLAITKSYVDMMWGKIEVDSEAGKGSTFMVEIPQKVIDWAPIGQAKNAVKEKKIRKKNEAAFYAPEGEILIVDDIQMNLDVMKGLLKQNKIQVDVATSGKMALEMAEQKKYDMIFMDHMMPEMDGVETFRQIKASEGPNHSTPVIMLTANAILGVEEEYLGEGFSGYLSKPVQYSHVEEMIIKFLPEEKVHLLS